LNEFDLDHIFVYHAASAAQVAQYQAIRDAAKNLCQVIIDNCPSSADRSDAIRKVRESVMTANASIALEGRLYKN
jgi:hypothetical protein